MALVFPTAVLTMVWLVKILILLILWADLEKAQLMTYHNQLNIYNKILTYAVMANCFLFYQIKQV